MDLAQLVRLKRLSAGLSGRQLADKIGVSHSYVSQIERGIIKKPSPAVLRRIVQVLRNCDLTELLTVAGHEINCIGAGLSSESRLEEGSTGSVPRGTTISKKVLEGLIRAAQCAISSAELRQVEVVAHPGFVNIPLYSSIPASFDQPSESAVFSYQDFETFKVLETKLNYDPDCFALRVKGDSMIDAGILPGDIVVVSPNTPYESGDVCVVRVNGGEHSIKRLIVAGTTIVLQPANPKYDPVIVDTSRENDLFIYGKVIYVERTLL